MDDKSSLAIASYKLQNEFIKILTNGSLNDVKIFFDAHGQIELPKSCSPLHYATENKNCSILHYLLEIKNLIPMLKILQARLLCIGPAAKKAELRLSFY